MRRHRRPTQHIRRYRSGRWTCVNRGTRYKDTTKDSIIRTIEFIKKRISEESKKKFSDKDLELRVALIKKLDQLSDLGTIPQEEAKKQLKQIFWEWDFDETP